MPFVGGMLGSSLVQLGQFTHDYHIRCPSTSGSGLSRLYRSRNHHESMTALIPPLALMPPLPADFAWPSPDSSGLHWHQRISRLCEQRTAHHAARSWQRICDAVAAPASNDAAFFTSIRCQADGTGLLGVRIDLRACTTRILPLCHIGRTFP